MTCPHSQIRFANISFATILILVYVVAYNTVNTCPTQIPQTHAYIGSTSTSVWKLCSYAFAEIVELINNLLLNRLVHSKPTHNLIAEN